MSHILVATLGTTPQVLTEAFYYHYQHLGIHFAEVHVLTTVTGGETVTRTLLGPKGVFRQMCRDLRISRRAVKFDSDTIHVLRGEGKRLIDDVRTTGDADAVREHMLTVMRHVCRDPHSTVHAIVSGGRKVMSIYLHAMMQLVGRPQDKLFHMLVHPLLEDEIVRRRRHLDFFYPTGPLRIGRRTIPAEELLAYVEVPLLCFSPRESLKGELSYADLQRERHRELRYTTDPPPLTIDVRRRQLRIEDVVVHLTGEQFYWYFTIARLATEGRGRLPTPELAEALSIDAQGALTIRADAEDKARLEDVLSRLQHYHGEVFPAERNDFARLLESDLHPKPSGVTEKLSKANRELRQALRAASLPYEVRGGRGRGHGLALPPEKIRVVRPVSRAQAPMR